MQNEANASTLLNRAALLTAQGPAAIAVVRLVGPLVDSFLTTHFSKPAKLNRCVHGLLHDGDRTIDDALIVRFDRGVDLNIHGGTWVVHSTLELAKSFGFSLIAGGGSPGSARAEPGLAPPAIKDEISIGNDGPTDIWREVLDALPQAKTEQAVRMLLAQPSLWEHLPTDPNQLREILANSSGRWLIQTPTVAIIGPPNVGKSTLANQLFGQSRSITADLPGTTRDWVGEIANVDGLAVQLLDTPGQRVTSDVIEGKAIEASQGAIRSADLVVIVLDRSQPLDRTLIDAYPTAILVANKSDQPAAWDSSELEPLLRNTGLRPVLADLEAEATGRSKQTSMGQRPMSQGSQRPFVVTSANTGVGIDDLRRAIRRYFGFASMDSQQLRWWTGRQRDQLQSLLNPSRV